MKILPGIILVIFSLLLYTCRQDRKTTSQDQNKPVGKVLADSVLLAQADSLYVLGGEYAALKKTDSALNFYMNALSIRERLMKNDMKLVSSYQVVAKLYLVDDKFAMADKYLEKAKRIAEDIEATPSVLFEIYDDLADCKREIKDYPAAISLAKRMLHVSQNQGSENNDATVISYSKLGSLYYAMANYKAAIENFNAAIKFTLASNHKQLGHLYINIGLAYRFLGLSNHSKNELEISLKYCNKSIREELLWEKFESEVVSRRLLQKAFVLMDLKHTDSAYQLLKTVLRIKRTIHGEKNLYTFGAKHSLGKFYYDLGLYDSAVWYDHQSLISLVKNFNSENWSTNPVPVQVEEDNNLVLGLVSKSTALRKLYDQDTTKVEWLDLALKTDLLADSVFSEFRKNLTFDDPQLAQMESAYISYPNILKSAFKLFQRKKNSRYLDDALKIMERARAVLLQDALKRAEGYGASGISKSFQEEEKKLTSKRQQILHKLESNIPEKVRDSLSEALLFESDAYLKLQDEIEKINPAYFSVRYENKTVAINDLQKFLERNNSILLEYLWSPENIYVLRVSSDTLIEKTIPVSSSFAKSFGGFVQEFHYDPEMSVDVDRFKKFCESSAQLHNYLVRDLIKNVRADAHLIISADGPLATIPFEALLTRNTEKDEVDYRLPYLVLEHPISYAYSSGVLLKQSARERNGKKLLAFGYAGDNQAGINRSGVSDLPGTEKEVLAIKDVMKNDVNKYKLQGDASEAFFKKQAQDFDIVHLAIHGEADTLNALNSRLIFRSEKDTTDDGSLYAHELYDLNLNKLDLVVLSACETGVGKQQAGEGVMSIARGFAYAGCPSLVVSLWKINDRTSAQVMKGFYNYLSNGELLDVALTKSKTDYIATANEFNSHPFYWASFLQVGNTTALDIKKPSLWGWVFLGLGVITFSIMLFIFKSRPRSFKKE